MSEPTGPDPSASQDAAPTCYRHPDRETYVRCTRCERPICPDCMISASVGFQCPECVAQGNKDVRQARTRYGGSLSGSQALITRILIGINLAAFVVQLLVGITQTANDWGLFPLAVANGDWYRMITSGFLHGSLLHIAFNMAALYFLGSPLEALLGRWRFLLVYGMSLLGGSVASYCFSPKFGTAVGASGAIFGLMGAFVVVAWKQKLDLRPFVVLIGLNLAIGFFPGTNIDWRAHLGGLVVGAVMAAAIVLPSRANRMPVLIGTVVALLVILGAAFLWRTIELRDFLDQFTRFSP